MMKNISECKINWTVNIKPAAKVIYKKDLVKKILNKEPELRPKISEIEMHPFFKVNIYKEYLFFEG